MAAMALKTWFCMLLLGVYAGDAFGFLLTNDGSLKIASFNIQVFGHSKFSHQAVMDILVEILSRYDIIAVLEIRDSAGTVFEGLRDALNDYVSQLGSSELYASVESDRLGRTSSKEQYGFLYKTSRVRLVDTYQYADRNDYFEREPFGARFHSPSTAIKDFAIIATHIRPDDAVAEIDHLTNAFRSFKSHWSSLVNFIISGDFNADCSYLSSHDWDQISLWTDTSFTWLVTDDIDTTVGKTFCSYDRFVVHGSGFPSGVVQGSVKAYRFDEELSLSHEMSLEVSDHYPIEMTLRAA